MLACVVDSFSLGALEVGVYSSSSSLMHTGTNVVAIDGSSNSSLPLIHLTGTGIRTSVNWTAQSGIPLEEHKIPMDLSISFKFPIVSVTYRASIYA